MRNLSAPGFAKYRNFGAEQHYEAGDISKNGIFNFPSPLGETLFVIASSGDGWEHVSVSRDDRTPTWEEMEYMRRIFWTAEEAVMQIHPPASEYVDGSWPGGRARFCLHLWRPIDRTFPRPPQWMVGANSPEEAQQSIVARALRGPGKLSRETEEFLIKNNSFLPELTCIRGGLDYYKGIEGGRAWPPDGKGLKMHTAQIIAAIHETADEETLSLITQAVTERRRALASMKTASIRPGQTVKLSANIRPSYLAGLSVEVVKINGASVKVNIPDEARYGRFKGSRNCRLPRTLIAI